VISADAQTNKQTNSRTSQVCAKCASGWLKSLCTLHVNTSHCIAP